MRTIFNEAINIFHNLKYPKPLVETTIKRFFERRVSIQEPSPDVPSETVRVVLPFKDQSSANYVKQQLNNLSSKLNVTVQPVFVSPKLEQKLKRHEIKPPIVNQQCIVYEFKFLQGVYSRTFQQYLKQNKTLHFPFSLICALF